MSTHERVRVPRIVWDGIMAVRECGETNMFDRNAVQYYADKLGYPHAVVWIEDCPHGDWGRLILDGPDIVDEVAATGQVDIDPTTTGGHDDLPQFRSG